MDAEQETRLMAVVRKYPRRRPVPRMALDDLPRKAVYLTAREVRAVLGINEATLYRRIKAGRLTAGHTPSGAAAVRPGRGRADVEGRAVTLAPLGR